MSFVQNNSNFRSKVSRFSKFQNDSVELSSSEFSLSKSSISQDISPNAMTVSDFIKITDNALKNFGNAIVVGEISELSNYRHLYFKIKDEFSSVDCVMWYSAVQALSFKPEIGMKVEIIGNSSVYQKTGQFKLMASSMRQVGLGYIMEQLRILQEKLQKEGIFDLLHRPIPKFVNTVGVITSTEGRVVHDIQMTMQRRNDAVNIIVYPASVQGQGASRTLIEALHQANNEKRCDVLIIGRGGGSFEDLLPFSDEALVREVAKSAIPIISAVGHEPDIALTDYAADLRAPTPTAAAELVTSVTKADLYSLFEEYNRRLDNAVDSSFDLYQMRLESVEKRLRASSPEAIIDNQRNLLIYAISELEHATDALLIKKAQQIENLKHRLSMFEPAAIVSYKLSALLTTVSRLDRSIDEYVLNAQNRLSFDATLLNYDKLITDHQSRLKKKLSELVLRQNNCDVEAKLANAEKDFANDLSKLELLNPLFILSKGYSVTKDSFDRIAKVKNLNQGDTITTLLDGGTVVSTVDAVLKSDNQKTLDNSTANNDNL
ncbi:MAG: exodeoxyribonuclease VII large subunit [Succinivibrio sp.]|nr:exodeoxyribonuclease VII large subunit [Succinivibrio sp.]MDD6377848.1 exodeoxyribonuclease VII large subunit [Succinatimonas sp.]